MTGVGSATIIIVMSAKSSKTNYQYVPIKAPMEKDVWSQFIRIARKNHRLSGGAYVAQLIEAVVKKETGLESLEVAK